MKVHKKETVVFYIELDREDAEILKDMVQNPINVRYEDEPEGLREWRHGIFDALKDALDG